MVKITDGSIEREVTKGAFDNLYSKMGFELVSKPKDKVISKTEVILEDKKEKEGAKESVKDSKRPSK